jgi:hypothetical protein
MRPQNLNLRLDSNGENSVFDNEVPYEDSVFTEFLSQSSRLGILAMTILV